MSDAPAISVLLPAFDAGATLASALTSIARQSERNWECIVVDDGSRDDTHAIAERFAARDERVRVLATAHDGIVSALNAGLALCRAPLVARMDADDWMSRRRLELQRAALELNPELAAVGCQPRFFPRRGLRDGLIAYERWLRSIASPEDVAREAFIECPVAHPTLMIRASLLARLGYRDAGWPEDYDLVLRLLADDQRLGMVPRRLLHWRDGSGRLSRTSARYSIPAFVACKAEFLARGFLAAGDEYILWGYGDTGKALADALARHGKHPAAILELHPRRLGQKIRGVRVVSPLLLPALPRLPVIVSVAGHGPRSEIRASLTRMGFVESRDYVCAA